MRAGAVMLTKQGLSIRSIKRTPGGAMFELIVQADSAGEFLSAIERVHKALREVEPELHRVEEQERARRALVAEGLTTDRGGQ